MSVEQPKPSHASAPETSRLGALRYRDFRLVFAGRAVTWIAYYMVMVAVGYEIYDRTGALMNLAYIGLAAFAPAVGFALVTGYVADLFDRRLVIAVCYAVMLAAALMFCALTLSETKAVWPVMTAVAVIGTGRAFYQPASSSLVPNLVPAPMFPNAVAWHSSIGKIAQVVGPALGGVVYLAGPEVVYATGAAGFAVGIAAMLLVRTRTQRSGRQKTTLSVLLAGLHYVYEKKIVFGAITVDLFVVLLGGVTALLPVYARDILDVGPSGAGFLRSAMAAGAVVTGLALTQFPITRAVGRVLFISIAIYAVATIAFGLSQLFWLSLIAMATLGGADMASVYIRLTLVQIATPDEMRGRVSAVNSLFTGASNELGEFRAGAMAALIGSVPAVVFGGVGSLAVAALCWRLFPELAKVERMDRTL